MAAKDVSLAERNDPHCRDNFTLAFDDSDFDKELYMTIVSALLHYTRQVLSTSAMARYFLQRVVDMQGSGARPIKTVLFLTKWPGSDYQVNMLLHGLKVVLGIPNVVDYERGDAVFKTPDHFNTTNFANYRHSLYGRGFTLFLQGWEMPDWVDRNNLTARIAAREFDLVVLGGGHKGIPPLYYEVCAAYDRSEVAMVYGNDAPIGRKYLELYGNCSQHIFSREIAPQYI